MGLSLLDAQMLQQGMGSMAQAGRDNQMQDLLGQATGMMGQPGGITSQQLMGLAQKAPDPARFIGTLAPAQQMRAKEIMAGAGGKIAQMLNDGRLDATEFASLEKQYGLNAMQIAELSIMVGKTIAKPKPNYMTLSKDEMLLQDGAPVMINPGAEQETGPEGPVLTLVSPKGKEVTVRRDSPAADKYMQMGFTERTTGRTTEDRFPGIGSIPQGEQYYKDENGEIKSKPISGGVVDREMTTKATKARNTLQSLEMQWDTVEKTLEKAIAQISPWTAGVGAWVNVLPASPQRNMRENLETIRANIGFDKLQDMRANSPTGGALGQVSDRENRLLQAVQGSMDQGQHPAQLKENLVNILENLRRMRAYKEMAFELDFRDYIKDLPEIPLGGGEPEEPAQNNQPGPIKTADDYLNKFK